MKHLFSLENQVVVITGGSGYLGSAMTEGLLSYGAQVVVADIVERKVELGDESLRTRLHMKYCDVSSSASIRNFMKETFAQFGQINILVNNAYYGAGNPPMEDMSDESWDKGMDGAAGTCFRCTREITPYFKKQGQGNIINIASMYGMVSPDPRIYGDTGANNPINYGAGKAAVIQLTRYSAAHLAHYGIRVNSISPGPFPQPSNQNVQDQNLLNELRKKTMLGRVGKNEDMAGTVIFLASPASSYITGANIPVDGGWTAW
jgi:NAD(P)-dependent dehydrogenase (short-subunit alcohol dehydrogenase family)